jgi:hypothetical protein
MPPNTVILLYDHAEATKVISDFMVESPVNRQLKPASKFQMML